MTAALEKTTAETTDPAASIGTRRAELAGEIGRLRRERGAAWADGDTFDQGKLAAAEAELAALEDAEGEFARRASDKAETERLALRRKQARRLAKVAANWISKIDEGEALARSLVAALKSAESARSELQGLSSALFGNVPTMLDHELQADRRSRSLAALLSAMEGKGNFGAIRLPSFLVAADDAWSGAERQCVETLTQQLKGSANDED